MTAFAPAHLGGAHWIAFAIYICCYESQCGTRLVRGRIAFEFSPSCAPQAPPGRAGRPPTHPYYPNARPYVGVWPDSTSTRRTKFHPRTQLDAAGKKHAHNLSKSGLNCLMMLPMPLREDGVALLDHERRRRSCRPLLLRTPQCNVSWRGGGARGSDGRGRGPKRSGPAGCSTYLQSRRTCSEARVTVCVR